MFLYKKASPAGSDNIRARVGLFFVKAMRKKHLACAIAFDDRIQSQDVAAADSGDYIIYKLTSEKRK